MSLVGNLRDLDLGDVLQVIGLSRKSGVLSVTTSDGEGRVVLQLGRVVSAAVKTGPHDLQGVLMGGLSVPADVLEAAIVEARACSDDLRGVLIEKGLLDRERIDALCRRAIESAVAELFGWTEGEFCFEVRTYSKPEDPELLYAAGLDVQYLAMESARALDELIVPESTDEFDAQGIEDLSAEEMFGVVEEGLEDSEKGMGPVSTHDVQPVEDATPLA
ncbi:MAG: DUF4388 domain-containing protein, partial [Myxococcota bacterium]|nr:DUF4388 domain-containing protein [Myxococcota bacterium]